MPSLLQQAGSQPQKSPRYVPLFLDRSWTGIWKQRSPLHDPSDVVTAKFYGGRPDALWDGSNVELTNKLTLQRRPGLTQFSPATYPTPPIHSFSLELTDGTIRVIVDTGLSPVFQMAEVDEISGVAFYHFYAPQACAANNAYRGLIFNIAGFDHVTNNGSYLCTASTSTYLILANTNATTDIANSSNATAQTNGGVYYDPQAAVGGPHNNYLLFAKQLGALETGFIAVSGTMYAGDGVDTWKYTPLNNNGSIADLDNPKGHGSVWNYAIAAPTIQPVVTTQESGAAAVLWQASTFYSTLGLLVQGNNIQLLTSININGTNNNSVYGTTGSGQPNWSNITGNPPTSGVDGSCNWINAGPLKLWSANTKFFNGDIVFVPGVGGLPLPPFSESNGDNTGKAVQCNGTIGGGLFQALINRDFTFAPNESATSGTATPAWVPNGGARTSDGINPGIAWQYIGPADIWRPNHIYNSWWEHLQMAVVEPSMPTAAAIAAGIAMAPGSQTFYVQRNNSQGPGTGATNVQGTSGSGYQPPWPPDSCANPSSVGQTTADGITGEMQWICLGCKNWIATTQYTAWVPGATQFSAIVDSNGNFQVCISGGLSKSGAHPTWETDYGTQTTDGSVIWVCLGSAADSTWTASTQWYFPASGFSVPTSAQSYGGASVIANGDVQAVINSGLSGSSPPSWGPIGTTTQDFMATWFTESAQSIFSLSWTKGYAYAYSYKSRATDDFYSVPSSVYSGPGQVKFVIPTPPGLNSQLTNGPLPSPTGAEVNGISEASPVFLITGGNVGAVNSIQVTCSTDPQVDTIIIWRSADGGGSANMFELTEIPNIPPVIPGQAATTIFQDYLPDTPTLSPNKLILYPGLNEEIQAPVNGQNDPPPSNFVPQAYNFQRIWGSAGQSVQWSGGPDIITGNANECYLASDDFAYLANVVRIIKNSQGLLVGLTDSIEFIGGGPLTASFFSFTLAPGIGMGNFNSSDIYAGEIFFVSSDGQFKSVNPSLQLANLGFPIGEQIAAMDSSLVYVTINQVGVDNALYIADGSTGWYRCNPHQVPQNEPIWSPFATITGGAQMVQSVEITPGHKKLLVGGTGCNEHILQRDLTVFTDNGTMYDAFFVMGSIMLAHPGQLALLKFIEADFSGVSYQPTVSYLLNEINDPAGTGVFVPMPKVPVFDPPSLYGTTIVPVSYSPNRYFFASTGSLARCRHLQIKVDLGVTPNPDTIYNMTIFGRIVVEG